MKIALAILLCAASLHAAELKVVDQSTPTSHSAQLAWTASPDGGTVNVYRTSGVCTAPQAGLTPIQTGVASVGPYTDSTVSVGSYCYFVTAVVSGSESAPSNLITLSISPQPPTSLSGTAK